MIVKLFGSSSIIHAVLISFNRHILCPVLQICWTCINPVYLTEEFRYMVTL